jgi:hypothetical protein
MPDELEFDVAANVIHVGQGRISGVTPDMWEYETSGYKMIRRWFAKRKRHPEGRRAKSVRSRALICGSAPGGRRRARPPWSDCRPRPSRAARATRLNPAPAVTACDSIWPRTATGLRLDLEPFPENGCIRCRACRTSKTLGKPL